MSTCQCDSCQPGAPGKTYSNAYRLACEAITLLSWSLEDRRAFLERVEKARGIAARRELEAAFLERWKASRASRAAPDLFG